MEHIIEFYPIGSNRPERTTVHGAPNKTGAVKRFEESHGADAVERIIVVMGVCAHCGHIGKDVKDGLCPTCRQT